MADREKDTKAKANSDSKSSAPPPKPVEAAAPAQPKSSLFSTANVPKMQPITGVEAAPQGAPQQAPPGPIGPTGQPVPPQQAPQAVRWTFNETGAITRQANFFAASLGLTESLFSFGNVARDGSATVNIDTKIVMSIYNAKRVLITLNQLVAQYEERYGRIDIGQ